MTTFLLCLKPHRETRKIKVQQKQVGREPSETAIVDICLRKCYFSPYPHFISKFNEKILRLHSRIQENNSDLIYIVAYSFLPNITSNKITEVIRATV